MKKAYVVSEVINTAMIVMAMIAFFLQIPIDDTTDNIASACLALVGSMSALLYFRFSNAFETHPISTFVIFGFCANTQLGALLVQSATLNSLSENLRQPVATFCVLLLYLFIAIAAHMTYRLFSKTSLQQQHNQSEFSARRLLEKLGMYATPTASQLWMLGLIGLFALLSTGNPDGQNVGNKISMGAVFLAWSPFLIPIFVARTGKQYCNTRLHYPLLVGFGMLIGLLGIAANARFMIVSGGTTVGMIALMVGMRSKRRATVDQIFKAVVLIAVCASMLIPFSQLATAMVMVRAQRSMGAVKVVNATIDVLMKPELIDIQRNRDKLDALIKPYDEYYVVDPVLARFVNTKFHDNALYFESKLTNRAEDELADTTVELLWSILPDPVLKYFEIKVAKKELKFTVGDYLFHQATGGQLGGYKYGSIFAHGIGLFGDFFTLIYFGICLFSFWVLDFLAQKNKDGEAMVTVVGILLIWRLFLYGITSESLNSTFGFLFREIPQSIVIFIVAYQLVRLIFYPFKLVDPFSPEKSYSGKAK
jgi:hypothetical protein